jgi:hypothetical protein
MKKIIFNFGLCKFCGAFFFLKGRKKDFWEG